MALDGETGCDPLGEAVLEACCIEAVPGHESDCVVGVYAVRSAAVGHDLSAVGDLAETRLQVADRDGDRAADVAGGVLGFGSNVEHDYVAVAEPRSESVAGDGAELAPVTQVVVCEPL
jgi:hypothetical protein